MSERSLGSPPPSRPFEPHHTRALTFSPLANAPPPFASPPGYPTDMHRRTVSILMSHCDVDKDGGISYDEFVDALARETVAPAAMGKRGMQSTEAMGVDNHPTGDRPVANWHASDTTDVTYGDGWRRKGLRAPPAPPVVVRAASRPQGPQALPVRPPLALQPPLGDRPVTNWQAPPPHARAAPRLMTPDDAPTSRLTSGAKPRDHHLRGAFGPGVAFSEGPHPAAPRLRPTPSWEQPWEQLEGVDLKGDPQPEQEQQQQELQQFLQQEQQWRRSNQAQHHGATEQAFATSQLDHLQAQIELAVNTRFPSASAAFVRIKKAQPNKVTAAELFQAVQSWGVVVPLEQVHELVARSCDDNQNGTMAYNEFSMNIMKMDHKSAPTIPDPQGR